MADTARAQALALLQAGRWDEAREAWATWLARTPGDGDGWYNLGWLRHRTGDPVGAFEAYAQALRTGADDPAEIHLNRATLLADHLGRPDEAEAELQAALATAGDPVPVLLNLGNLHEQCGRRDAAHEAYARALAHEPANALALARRLDLEAPKGSGDLRLAAVQAALAAPGRHPAERADLGFALARALDRLGDWDAAFAAGRAANAASREAAGGVRYDRALAEAHVARMLAAWPAAPQPLAPDGEPDPIFLCGMVRSGSTLAERILAAHPAVQAGGELELVPALARRLRGTRPDAATLAGARDAYRARLAAVFPTGTRVTDKRPDNLLHLGLVRSLFAGARIVHTQRDPRDTALSVFFLHLTPTMPWALDPADTGHWWRQQQRIAAHWRAQFGEAILGLAYEALVADPEPQVRALLAHCGLAFDPACLHFHERPGFVQTPSGWQVRRPLNADAVGRWRPYQRHLGPLLAVLDRP